MSERKGLSAAGPARRSRGRRFLRNAAALAASAAMSGCAMFGGDWVNLSSSPSVPAAEGRARFTVTQNDNTRIDLSVEHLAHPEMLTPQSFAYVVWTKAGMDAAPQSIGALTVGDDLSGALQTETSLHSFDLFVTAEASGQTQRPTGRQLLWYRYSR